MDLFRIVASVIMLLMGFMVVSMNVVVFRRMMSEKEGFHKICMNKAVANILIGLVFIVWCAPISLLNFYYLPERFNSLFGVIIGWGPYLMSGPFTQVCLAINRSIAIFLPYRYYRRQNLPYTKISMVLLWIIAIIISIPSLREGCGFVFHIEAVAWNPMDDDCSRTLTDYFVRGAIFLACLSLSINAISIGNIIKNVAKGGVSEQLSNCRKRKRIKMFVQCIIQDCVHVSDCLITTYVYLLNSAQWFQFLCGSVTVLTVIFADGLIMVLFNRKSKSPKSTNEMVLTISHINLAK